MREAKKTENFSLKRVIIKGIVLFLLIDFLFAIIAPLPFLGRLSVYNHIFPGRVRLPYGENPAQAYNTSLYNLDAMFASHELAKGEKPADEYRVLLIGDSSVWGYLLEPEYTLSADLSDSGTKIRDGRTVGAYNLGYPTLSLAKDLLVLNYSMRYQPDLIIWLVTLESFPITRQLDSPIAQNNPSAMKDLISSYDLELDPADPRFVIPNFLGSTLIGQRRGLADIIRLQLYGVMWAATGIDQYYPASYEPPQEDLVPDETFHDLQPPKLYPADLSLDVLSAGRSVAGNVPMLIVNEPVYISHGENSDIRYNFFYPRWAYDQYRQLLAASCHEQAWNCLDVWDLVPPGEFTNSAIHMSPTGTKMLAAEIQEAILALSNP